MARPFARRAAFLIVTFALFGGGSELALRLAGWPKKDGTKEFTHAQVYWSQPPNQHLEPYTHKETGATFRVRTIRVEH